MPRASTSPTVLVIDDEPANLHLIEDTLVPLGWTVVSCLDARSAAKFLADARPNLVLLDAVMPEESGIEVCRRWRARRLLENVPIILLTSISAPAYRSLGFAAGANGYLEKPLDAEAVLRLARRWSNGRGLEALAG
jgi:two-component system sensor histidine kinase ChiS